MRETGKVKWFKNEFGYGFINPDTDPELDCFIHYRNIEPESKGFKTLAEGDAVSFVCVESDKGYAAMEVERL